MCSLPWYTANITYKIIFKCVSNIYSINSEIYISTYLSISQLTTNAVSKKAFSYMLICSKSVNKTCWNVAWILPSSKKVVQSTHGSHENFCFVRFSNYCFKQQPSPMSHYA